jgi:hypothetical protein
MNTFIFQPRKPNRYKPRTPQTPSPTPPPTAAVVIAATVPGGERPVRVSENDDDEVKDED